MNNEEPLPARNSGLLYSQYLLRPDGLSSRATYHAMHFENPQCNESRKSSSEDVASVQNGDARSQLFSRVERCQDVQCAWVVRSFGDAQEESREQQACVVSADSSQATDDSPHSHAGGHPYAGFHPCDHHVRRNADNNVTSEQDGNTSLVLLRSQAKVFFKRVQSGECDCIAVLASRSQLAPQITNPKP